MQKALIVSAFWDDDGEKHSTVVELNDYLERGWKVISATPMGGFGYGYAGGAAYGSVGGESSYNINDLYFRSNEGNGFMSLVVIDNSDV